jgi:hypothetical protein
VSVPVFFVDDAFQPQLIELISILYQFSILILLASWRLIWVVVVSCTALAPAVHAQSLPRPVVQQRAQEVDHLFNWYYASVYGTGAYKIGEESVAVARLPLAYTARPANEEQWGFKLTLPVSVALAEFDLTDLDLGNVTTAGLSVLPGIEVEIPLSAAWTVRPFVNVGGGWEFQRDSSALIYAIGATAAWHRPVGENLLLGFGSKLVYAGYKSGSESSTLAALSLGGDLGFPLEMEISGRQAILGTQLIGTVYFNELQFLMPGSGVQEVSKELEAALTLGVRRPLEILGVSFDRIGLGYRRGSNGLRGLRLVGSFPF